MAVFVQRRRMRDYFRALLGPAGRFAAYATSRGRALVDRELYLPKCWMDDRERCRAAKIPDERVFATKPELARAITARPVAPEEAKALGLAAGSLGQALQRTYYAGATPVETADLVLPTGRFELVYEFPVGGDA